MGRWITKNGSRIYLDDGSGLVDALAEHYSKSKLPTVYLERKEYGHVTHEINTWYKKEYDDKTIISKAVGDYVYTFENHGYNEYRFISKDIIESDRYSKIEEVVKNVRKRK